MSDTSVENSIALTEIQDMATSSVSEVRQPEDNAGVQFPPPLIHAVAILISVAGNALNPVYLPYSDLFWWLGQVLLASALVLSSWGFATFNKAHNPVRPDQPVQG